MKTRTTLLLLVITAALAAWIIVKDRKGPPPNLEGHLLFDYSDRVMDEGRASIDINPAEIAVIESNSAAGVISLRRRPDATWDITKSIKDRADYSLVSEILKFVTSARIETALGERELQATRSTPETLGLDDAGACRIIFRKEGGARLATIRVGLTAPLGDACYAQIEDQRRRPDTYIVTPDIRLLLARPIDTFRDPMISRISEANVQRVIIHKGEGEVEFSRASVRESDASPWVISRPLSNAMALQPAVKEYISLLCSARIASWPDAAGTPPVPPMPEVEIAVYAGSSPDKKPVSLTFFPDTTAPDKTAWCHDKQRKATYRVARSLVDDLLLATTPDSFRDTNLANMDPAAITSVEIQSKFGPPILAALVGEKWSWRHQPSGEWKEASNARASILVDLINKTKILEFTADTAGGPQTYGMDSPAFIVRMNSAPAKSLDALAPFAGPGARTLRIGILDDGKIYANFEGEPFIYRIGAELPGGIPVRDVKWRSLVFPGFSSPQLRTLKWTRGTDPSIDLTYSALTFKWTATRDAQDLTPQLDASALETLVLKAGTLQAHSWLEQDAANAAKALERPALVIDASWEDYGEDSGDVHLSSYRLEIAPPVSPNALYCFARHSSSPEPFLLETRLLRELTQPILKAAENTGNPQ